jgi:hypothetical protein
VLSLIHGVNFIGLWNSSMFIFPSYDDIILSCSISFNIIHSKNSFTIIHLWKFHLHHQLYAIYQFINNWVFETIYTRVTNP